MAATTTNVMAAVITVDNNSNTVISISSRDTVTRVMANNSSRVTVISTNSSVSMVNLAIMDNNNNNLIRVTSGAVGRVSTEAGRNVIGDMMIVCHLLCPKLKIIPKKIHNKFVFLIHVIQGGFFILEDDIFSYWSNIFNC